MKKFFYIISLVLVILLLTFVYLKFIYLNFHTVIPAKVYRSAEPNAAQWLTIKHRYHIRSILNLRGKRPSKMWYVDEAHMSKRLHVPMYTLELHSKKIPTLSHLRLLANWILDLPKPMLIHCRSGADRTGLASAMSLVLLSHPQTSVVQHQYSWRYLALAHDSIGKLVMPLYFCYLHKQHKRMSRRSMLTWLAQLRVGVNYPTMKQGNNIAPYLQGCHE